MLLPSLARSDTRWHSIPNLHSVASGDVVAEQLLLLAGGAVLIHCQQLLEQLYSLPGFPLPASTRTTVGTLEYCLV